MTRRLEARLLHANRRVEAHYYEGEDHIPGSDGENRHHEKLLDFLDRSLA